MLADVLLDDGGDLRVERRQHLVETLDDGHGAAAGDERLGHLEADVAGADDERRSDLPGVEQPAQRDGLLERADGEGAVGADVGHRDVHRRGAGRDHEAGVGEPVRALALAVDDPATGRVELGGHGRGAHVDAAVLGEPFHRVGEQVVRRRHHAREVVRQAAQAVGDVRRRLEDDHVERRVGAPRCRRGRHPGRAAPDHDHPFGHAPNAREPPGLSLRPGPPKVAGFPGVPGQEDLGASADSPPGRTTAAGVRGHPPQVDRSGTGQPHPHPHEVLPAVNGPPSCHVDRRRVAAPARRAHPHLRHSRPLHHEGTEVVPAGRAAQRPDGHPSQTPSFWRAISVPAASACSLSMAM